MSTCSELLQEGSRVWERGEEGEGGLVCPVWGYRDCPPTSRVRKCGTVLPGRAALSQAGLPRARPVWGRSPRRSQPGRGSSVGSSGCAAVAARPARQNLPPEYRQPCFLFARTVPL